MLATTEARTVRAAGSLIAAGDPTPANVTGVASAPFVPVIGKRVGRACDDAYEVALHTYER